ncbi:acyl-CoA dehydrogenase family protein [Cryptosporangium aurantiacum]|uniref:Acyl-CoA dehydrogenase n=1 Tax=Cryptosporangium aurantiacum TaxID=134849 RepID=A0A1M7PKB1_9ACTN|nr:acyl-CoA dehydrogenase family protein [Cryptosporangium aurantiacum]SHN17386.1 Acyl-CoA dehydrogenase [Cryptosporangium aurantiacum]
MSSIQPEDEVRTQIRAWLAEHPRPEGGSDEWRAALIDSGWAAPTWPVEWYGRGLPREMRAVVREEFARAGVKAPALDITQLFANTVLVHGTDEQKRAFVRPLALGEFQGCLLYSEPGAGSDLAALQTRAVADGGRWIVNGQKVWTSGARNATHGLLIARTDWDVPKHRGLTFFLIPMDQPGIDIRPIHQVTGGSEFNEVFLTDAVVSDANRLGDVNNGWRVLQTALGFERLIMGGASGEAPKGFKPKDGVDPVLAARQSPWTRQTGGADYVELAKKVGKADDPVTRQEIARLYTLEKVNAWNSLRARANAGGSSPLASIGKLAMSRIQHTGVRVTTNLIESESVLDGDTSPVAGEINRSSFAAFVTSIGGGTDQIQRNIIGERVLGLPKEPEVDKNVPFREVRKAQGTRSFS